MPLELASLFSMTSGGFTTNLRRMRSDLVGPSLCRPLIASAKTWGKWRCDRFELTCYRAEEVFCLACTAFPSRLTCPLSFASSLFVVAHQPPLLVATPWCIVATKEETSMPDWQCRVRLNALDRLLYSLFR